MINYYEFLHEIQEIVNNLDNIDSYKERKCLENIVFKQDLDFNLKFVNKLLEKTKMV
jgi:hypothetical protein